MDDDNSSIYILNENRIREEPGDILLFSSLEALLGWVEVEDIASGAYFVIRGDGGAVDLHLKNGQPSATVGEAREDTRKILKGWIEAFISSVPDAGPDSKGSPQLRLANHVLQGLR